MQPIVKSKKKPSKVLQVSNEAKADLEARQDAFLIEIADSFGVPGMDKLVGHLLGQLQTVLGGADTAEDLTLTLQAVTAIRPRNALEIMLVTQLVGVHTAAISSFRRANIASSSNEYSIETTECYFSRGSRLMQLFLSQLEALSKLRGENVQQKVVVEHVTVNAGGQAVVGAVNTQGGRG